MAGVILEREFEFIPDMVLGLIQNAVPAQVHHHHRQRHSKKARGPIKWTPKEFFPFGCKLCGASITCAGALHQHYDDRNKKCYRIRDAKAREAEKSKIQRDLTKGKRK